MAQQQTRLQVSFAAKGLKNLAGVMNTSDPFAVLTLRGETPNDPPSVVGQTEVRFDNLDPQWSTVITLDGFQFGVPMYIEVGVFDYNAKKLGENESKLSLEGIDRTKLLKMTESTRSLMKMDKLPHKVMGTALFEVGEILGSRGNMKWKSLQTGGKISVHIERSRTDGLKGKMRFQLRGINLVNTRKLGKKSNPYFELYRRVDRPSGASWSSVYRSNVIKGDLNPKWDETLLDLELTCNGDLDRPMKVVVRDHRSGGHHKEMGEFETSMKRFVEAKEEGGDVNEEAAFTLMRHDKFVGHVYILKAAMYSTEWYREKEKESDSTSRTGSDASGPQNDNTRPEGSISPRRPRPDGSMRAPRTASPTPSTKSARGAKRMNHKPPISEVTLSAMNLNKPRPNYIDYLTGGCEVSLAVAIDFTGSNGNPNQPGTPHYFQPPELGQWNDYQKAIFAVGTILAKYDSDQMFPVWGFGAKYNGVTRHCFQCGDQPEVQGVKGILAAYQGVFNTPLIMSYPTKFTEVIQTASSYAQHEQDKAHKEGKQSYTILLILTAGDIKDEAEVQATKRQLIEASNSPLSVVIVGIGDKDFSGMEFLDMHDPQKEGGRDITKFVEFSEYKSYNLLTAAVLDEIPDQLVDYFYDRGIMPGTAETVDPESIEELSADEDDRAERFLR